MIATNLATIRQTIASVARQCNRDPQDIQLVAVSKRFPADVITEAMEAGQLLFGENYIQEAELKKQEISPDARLHFIGHLQSNKAKIAATLFHMIETIDSFKLAQKLNNQLVKLGRTMDILVQVNIGQDSNKSGVLPENAEQLLRQLQPLRQLRVCGLMTMPPFTEDPEDARPYFRSLRSLSEVLKDKNLFSEGERVELSMGMSKDYHIAIEEGATLIRVGTAIFGQRPPQH